MFEYDFVSQPRATPDGGYRQLVHERARQGWRLVQVLVEQPAVVVADYVLIFERPVTDAHRAG